MKKTVTQLSWIILLGISLCVSCKPKEEQETPIEGEEELVVMTSPLPQDVLPSCVVDSTSFNSWFESGKATENGMVNAANSVTFTHQNNCDFYKWSQQMFLWITSPTKVSGKRVFESPVFYTVSTAFNRNDRKLIPHTPGMILSAMPTIEKSVNNHNDSEEGQATGDALMSKDSAMVYYITMVNDVYAEFLSAVSEGKMGGKTFPTTQAELDSIVNYANTKGIKLPDANALAMEIKTSWVEASTISETELSNYVVIDAYIPTYEKTSTKWTILNKSVKTKLALLGVHIVGSAAGHPEMIWSTFEHQNNAPSLSYSYIDKNNQVQKVAADTSGNWVLNSNPKDTVNINISHMKFKGDSIYSNFKGAPANNTISPSNSTKTKPWGVANVGVPNPENATAAASNSQVISINNSVFNQLPGNDVRKNYYLIGSTWTDSGLPPTGVSYSATNPNNTGSGVAIGTSQLANSTMETYAQNGTAYSEYGSCFACHSGSTPTNNPNSISHVYSDILAWKKQSGTITSEKK